MYDPFFTFLLTLAPFDDFATTLAKAKRFTHFYSVALLPEKWFACHHSTPYFFILLFLTAFYDHSRMTGRYLIPFCKKLFYLSAHTCPFRRVTFPILSLFPVMQRRLFLFDQFLYFLFVTHKKTRVSFFQEN